MQKTVLKQGVQSNCHINFNLNLNMIFKSSLGYLRISLLLKDVFYRIGMAKHAALILLQTLDLKTSTDSVNYRLTDKRYTVNELILYMKMISGGTWL